ncbi:MAG: hypothetical protein GY847_09395 [Proteobacteria bacterium]|nr:hypothetical protein [Pseudomonadota bacterium]
MRSYAALGGGTGFIGCSSTDSSERDSPLHNGGGGDTFMCDKLMAEPSDINVPFGLIIKLQPRPRHRKLVLFTLETALDGLLTGADWSLPPLSNIEFLKEKH